MSHHSCLILSSLAENNRTHRIQIPVTHLLTIQPPYLHHLISVQPRRSTRSSSLVTLARPPTSSSLRISDRSFRYASLCLWNQLRVPSSLRQLHSSLSVYDLPVHAPNHISLCQLTTLTTHNSLSLSLSAQNLHLSQIFPTIDSLSVSELSRRTL